MKRSKKLNDLEIIFEMYRRIYRESDPPLDFDAFIESKDVKKDEWFREHYLDENRMIEIIEEVLNENKVKGKRVRQSFRFTILLGCSPRSVKIQK